MKKNLILKFFTVFSLMFVLLSCKISPTEMKRNDVQFRSKPSAVKSVSVPAVMTTDDGVTVSWSYVDDATGYYLYYQTANEYLSDSTPRSVRLSKDDISYTFNNLNKAERYVFSVQSYKVVDNEELKGDMSAYKESATKPDLEVKQVLKDTNAILYFSTSERGSVVHPGKDIYDPEFVIYSNLDNDSEVISQAFGTKAVTDSLKLYDTVKGVSLVEIPVKSNAEIQFAVNMRVENTDLGNTKNELTVKTDPNLYPSPIKSVETTNGLKDRIEIEFEASPINDGVDGKQVFEIIRENKNTNQKTTVLAYTDEKNQPVQNLETKKYTFVDKNVTSNVQYTYTVQPYYVINNGKASNTKSESAKSVSGAYSLPAFETLKGELRLVKPGETGHKQYKIEDTETNTVKYTVDLLFALPNYINTDGLTYSVFRTNAANALNGAEDTQDASDNDSAKNVYIVDNGALPEGEENGSLVYFKLVDTVPIKIEEDKVKNSFQYTIWLINNKEFGEITTSSAIDTKPSIEEVDFIKTFTASDTSENASNITLNFSLISAEELNAKITSETLDLNKVKFILYRGDIAANKEEVWIKTYEEIFLLNGVFNDDNNGQGLLNDHSYYYQLRAIYEDEKSSYNKIYQFKYVESAKTLSDVKELTASQGDSTKGITLTFTPVKEATSYAVYYKSDNANDFIKAGEDILTINKDEGTALFTKDVNTANAGKKYIFRINAKASNGKETLPSTLTAEGYLYGPYDFKVEATNFTTENIYKDRIELSWTEIPHTLRYEIDVYSEKNANVPLNTYQVKNATSYSFKTTEVENDESISFPLSRPYYFKVRPLLSKDETIDSAFLDMVEGSWILPPKNIVASKAESWNTINVSWDNIGESALVYKVYRKEINGDSWDRLADVQNVNGESTISYIDSTAKNNKDYMYTVTSIIENALMESEKQVSFNETEGLADNIGYLLSPPNTAIVTENSNSEYIIKISPFKNIESHIMTIDNGNYSQKYIIRGTDGSFNVEYDTSSSANVANSDIKVTKNKGIITITMKRPTIVDAFEQKLHIKTLSEKNGVQSTSSSYDISVNPQKITHQEIVNVTNGMLKELLIPANEKMGGDWWGFSQWSYSGDGYKITSESGTSGNDDSYIQLSEYKDAVRGITLTTTTNIKMHVRNGGGAGYLGTDPLDHIGKNKKGVLKATLPGNYGEATIVYDTVKVDGSSGTYTVTYNGTTETLDYTQVHESQRALL